MSRIISRAESYETIYSAFKQINFAAFDYYSIKQSMIDYLQLYFPESFNDYIESSEFLALIETFAYLGEIIAYRIDIVGAENAIALAQRKASILRLAKLVSYKASRNVPARGLVKINSVSTTERVFDSQGRDISNTIIVWNDPNNPNWKDQFFIVMGRILQQDFGTVSPNERVQVNDVIFELYPLKNNPLTRGVVPYRSSVAGQNYVMELVSSVLNENGPSEARPANNANFNVLYGNDGLGDNSNLTGFFMYTKQGIMSKQTVVFDGIIPNQTFDIGVNDVNNTDVWVNNIDPDTGLTIDNGSSENRASGEWEEVDLASAENIIFNTNPTRTKYEIETLENDDVRIIFGDGEFSDIPSGTFEVWYRTSVADEIYIPRTAISEKRASLTYNDVNSRVQTTTFTFSLVSSLQNNAASEDIEHIRRTAPSVYYAQDRMVNGRDYNTFPLQDSSILKLRTVNRTFAGDTKYQSANDPSFSYQNVRVFGEDLSIFYPDSSALISAPGSTTSGVLIENYVEPLLSTIDVYLKHIIDYTNSGYRREFTPSERLQITNVFDDINYPWPVSLVYFDESVSSGESPDGISHAADTWVAFPGTIDLGDFKSDISIDLSNDQTTYTITYIGKRMVGESGTTHFFYDNSNQRILSFDSLNGNFDELVILQANRAANPSQLLTNPINLKLIEVDTYTDGSTSVGLPNINRVVLSTYDTTGDMIPDNLLLTQLMNTQYPSSLDPGASITTPQNITLPVSYITGLDDVNMPDNLNVKFAEDGMVIINVDFTPGTQQIQINGNVANRVSVGNVIRIYTPNTLLTQPNSHDYKSYIVRQVNVPGGYTNIVIDDAGETYAIPNPDLIDDLIPGEVGIASVEGVVSKYITVYDNGGSTESTTVINDYVYFSRQSVDDHFTVVDASDVNKILWSRNVDETLIKRVSGKDKLNFLWKHTSSQLNLIDPATTNIHDMFIITRPYYTQYSRWLSGDISTLPTPATPQELRTTYSDLLDNKMLSDTIVLHPGKFKVLLGSKATPELRGKIKIIRSKNRTLSDNQIKIRVVNIVRSFFDVNQWEFGESFFYTELDTKIQTEMPSEIASTVLVPTSSAHVFGDLYQVFAREDEILQVHVTVDDIEIVDSYNSSNLHQNV